MIEVEWRSAEHDEGLLALFDAASSGCYCRFWDFDGEDNDWLARCASGENRAEVGSPRGVVALVEGEVVGWLKLAPVNAMHKLRARRVYRTLAYFAEPRADTLVIGCLLVHPGRRSCGVGRALVAGAIRLGRARGARFLEAFPRVAQHRLADHELQMGPAALYTALGFEVVDGPTPYPVMRLRL